MKTKIERISDYFVNLRYARVMWDKGVLADLVADYRRGRHTDFKIVECQPIAAEIGHGVTADDVWGIFRVILQVVEEQEEWEELNEARETDKAIAILKGLQRVE